MDSWRFLTYSKLTACENMAIDEAVFRESQHHDTPPTLRFYSWNTPSVSIGYFQDVAKEVDLDACRQYHYDVVRRPTGGKAVFHYNDLTYAIIAKTKHPPFTDDILGTYKIISQCIANGLGKMNIKACMAEEKRLLRGEVLEAFCFSVPSQHELLVDGKKICGSAQVRSHGSFLQHGSLMISFDPAKTQEVLLPHIDRDNQVAALTQSVTSILDHTHEEMDIATICRALKDGIKETLNIEIIDGRLTTEEETLKAQLEKKYRNPKWNTGKYYKDTIKVSDLTKMT